MRIDVLRKVAKILNDNKIQYRIREYSFLGETLDLDGAGFTVSVDDGDQATVRIVRHTPSAKLLLKLVAAVDGHLLPFRIISVK